MTTTPNAPDAALLTAGWLIHKAGRGYYRPNAQGYTNSPLEAGRYTYTQAMDYSHPNGLEGPTDGISIKHESEVPGAIADAGQSHADAALLAALEAVTDDLEAEIEAKRGTVLARTTERDLASVRAARAAIAAAKGVDQ